MAQAKKKQNIVVSALRARTHFGKLLPRVESEGHSLIIEKRGTPRAVLLGIRDYVRLAAPEPFCALLARSQGRKAPIG